MKAFRKYAIGAGTAQSISILSALVGLFVILGQVTASAAHPSGVTTYKAPYNGKTAPMINEQVSGCEKTSNAKPFFKMPSGKGGDNVSTSAKSCKQFALNDALTGGGIQIFLRLSTVGGTSKIYANATFNH